jgi:hypothetical protein
LIFLLVSVHGQLAPLFLSRGEAKYHKGMVKENRSYHGSQEAETELGAKDKICHFGTYLQ